MHQAHQTLPYWGLSSSDGTILQGKFVLLHHFSYLKYEQLPALFRGHLESAIVDEFHQLPSSTYKNAFMLICKLAGSVFIKTLSKVVRRLIEHFIATIFYWMLAGIFVENGVLDNHSQIATGKITGFKAFSRAKLRQFLSGPQWSRKQQ